MQPSDGNDRSSMLTDGASLIGNETSGYQMTIPVRRDLSEETLISITSKQTKQWKDIEHICGVNTIFSSDNSNVTFVSSVFFFVKVRFFPLTKEWLSNKNITVDERHVSFWMITLDYLVLGKIISWVNELWPLL